MAKPLTAVAVKTYRAGATRREIADGGSPGLYLAIETTGSKRWILRYRRPNGKTARLVLGTVYNADKETDAAPVVGGHHTLASARRLAAALQHELAQGRDPGVAYLTAKQQRSVEATANATNTFGIAAKDFIEKYSAKKVRRWKEHARLLGLQPSPDGLLVIRKGLAERWRDKPIADITGHDIHNLIVETRERGAPGLERRAEGPTDTRARAMGGVLSRMFKWLVQHRRAEQNPCAGVYRPEVPKSRDRVLTPSEVIKFWTATNSLGRAVWSVAQAPSADRL